MSQGEGSETLEQTPPLRSERTCRGVKGHSTLREKGGRSQKFPDKGVEDGVFTGVILGTVWESETDHVTKTNRRSYLGLVARYRPKNDHPCV